MLDILELIDGILLLFRRLPSKSNQRPLINDWNGIRLPNPIASVFRKSFFASSIEWFKINAANNVRVLTQLGVFVVYRMHTLIPIRSGFCDTLAHIVIFKVIQQNQWALSTALPVLTVHQLIVFGSFARLKLCALPSERLIKMLMFRIRKWRQGHGGTGDAI